MSNEQPVTPRRWKPWKIIALPLLALLIVGGFWGYVAYSQYAEEERIIDEMARLNASVTRAGYGNSSVFGKVPVLRDFISYRQLEVFLRNKATADEVLAKVSGYPQVKRVWVNLNAFERSMAGRIEAIRPGMDVIFYTEQTPGNTAVKKK